MLFLKHVSAAITFETTTDADVDAHCSYGQLTDGAFLSTFGSSNVQRTVAGTSTLIAGVSDTVTRGVKTIEIKNVDSALSTTVIVRHNSGTTTVILYAEALLPGESLVYEDQEGWDLRGSGVLGVGSKKLVPLLLPVDTSTITPAEVTGFTTALEPGTYVYMYQLLYSSAANTTGVSFSVNFDGTATKHVYNQYWSDNGTTAATSAADQDNIGAAGHILGCFASRASSTAGRGVTVSVDTGRLDMMMTIKGLLVVTVAGNLELWHGPEVAAQTFLHAGSSLIINRTA